MIRTTACCGVREFDGLDGGSEATVKEVVTYLDRDDSWRFLVFTDITADGYGSRLSSYVKKHKLGNIVCSRSAINPNTDNRIKVWVWELNHRAVKAWGAKRAPAVVEAERQDDFDW